jgi:hypothetical protein
MFLDYAHDETAESTGLGNDGRSFGRFSWRVPFLLSLGLDMMFWTGLASWLPFGGKTATTTTWLQKMGGTGKYTHPVNSTIS